MKNMMILALIAVAAATDMTCSISCTTEGTNHIVKVLHDTTSAHTHHRCYNDPAANVCRCECCTDTTDDCDDHSNYTNNPVCAAGFHAFPQNDVNGVCVACSSGTFDNNADGLDVCEDHTQCPLATQHLTGHSDIAAGSCTDNICSCTNGTPVANGACTSHSDNQCASCTGNYHLSNGSCVANVCTCANGIAKPNAQCTVNGATQCSSCTGNFNGATCAANVCTCANGTAKTTDCTSNGATQCSSCTGNFNGATCAANICSCSNGAAATGTACTSNGGAICSSCSGGHYLSGTTCYANPTPAPAPVAQWILDPRTPRGAQSCDVVCADVGKSCKQSSLNNLNNNDAAFAAAFDAWSPGHCHNWHTGCAGGNNCANWGSPFIHSSHVNDHLCWKGSPVAACNKQPVDGHHRRLCPCE